MRIVRALLIACVFTGVACGDSRFDRTKFENVTVAAEALRRDVIDAGGAGSAQFPELLNQFRQAIAAISGRIDGRRERAVRDAYTDAAKTYDYLLRFKLLGREAVGGMVLLRGSNRPIASRYGLAIEERGGGRWVNRNNAMKVFREEAARELSVAASLLSTN